MRFPIDLGSFRPLAIDPLRHSVLNAEQRTALAANVALCRDVIIFFTAIAEAKGLGGHTGGPYDIVPEVLIAESFIKAGAPIVPVHFDEAGHRVAIQYLMSVLRGHMSPERLLHYREADSRLPGHSERDYTPGVDFSSGRLGHLWPYVNGVALANPGKAVLLYGSDGAQQEGNDAEAARMAVAHNLNVKVVVDDNDTTISGHPSGYMPGFDVAKTLAGHGLPVDIGDGEDLDRLFARMAKAIVQPGPIALVNKRKMAPGVAGIEGSTKGHDVIKASDAITYLTARGQDAAVAYLKAVEKPRRPGGHRGSSTKMGKNREVFGQAVNDVLGTLTPEQRKDRVLVVDSDLAGSCGLSHIQKAFPDVYMSGGIMERTNFSACAGFGMEPGRQGVFATFSAFLEMIISELTMARLNKANVLCHFSHAGVDDMADNSCHFGINNFFADNGMGEEDKTRLYFPADQHQMRAVVKRVWDDPGLRFVFSTRSETPEILDESGQPLFAAGYEFQPGKDEIIRRGTRGYIVSYGEMLYRALDAVERLRGAGVDVGLINKTTLNVVDEEAILRAGETSFVLVVESQSVKTGLGVRYGTWLLERGLSPRYAHIGTHREGAGGLWEHMAHQGLDAESIIAKIRAFV
ncbi:MAG TPA: transketolase C-terminal domain-containing protein [Polyangiales bacterium]|nr:transketolase C-terminal domain-containing protein [Polyangiales bacterium]